MQFMGAAEYEKKKFYCSTKCTALSTAQWEKMPLFDAYQNTQFI